MVECARCGDFTDNRPDGNYSYCENCLDEFDQVRAEGIVVRQQDSGGGYDVSGTQDAVSSDIGFESTQVDALARGRHLTERHNCQGLFEYKETGSTWILDEYLQAHPNVRRDVQERLNRVPDESSGGMLNWLRNLF